VLFTNVRIIDGSGAQPYSGEGAGPGQTRIARVARGVRFHPHRRHHGDRRCRRHLDAWHDRGRTRISPGTTSRALNAIQRMAARGAHPVVRPYRRALSRDGLDLLCRRRAPPSRALDVVIRNAIASGQIKGPRYLAASQEITVPGGLGR